MDLQGFKDKREELGDDGFFKFASTMPWITDEEGAKYIMDFYQSDEKYEIALTKRLLHEIRMNEQCGKSLSKIKKAKKKARLAKQSRRKSRK